MLLLNSKSHWNQTLRPEAFYSQAILCIDRINISVLFCIDIVVPICSNWFPNGIHLADPK